MAKTSDNNTHCVLSLWHGTCLVFSIMHNKPKLPDQFWNELLNGQAHALFIYRALTSPQRTWIRTQLEWALDGLRLDEQQLN